MLESARGHLRAMDGDGVGTSPNGAVFVVDSKNRFRVDSSHHGQLPIQQVLSSFAPDLSFRRVRMNPILYGNPPKLYDFIIRERTPLNELVEALNLSFQQNPTIPIEVSLVEEKFTTLVVHNQPQSTTFSREMRLRLVPDGYEGPTEITTRHGTWSRMIDLVAQHSLEVEWKLDAPSSPTMGILTVEVPKALKNATNQFDQAQRMAELQAKSEMLAKMRLLAPKAFKEQLGVVVEVREIPLPVVQIEPLQVVAPASVPAVPLKPEKSR